MNSTSAMAMPAIIQTNAEVRPQQHAVVAPDRAPLTYARLYQQICQIVETLNSAGIGRGDRVGLIAENGPEMLVAYISVTSATGVVLFKPSLRRDEFESMFTRTHLQALIIERGLETPAREVAQSLGLPVIDLVPRTDAEAGLFALMVEGGKQPRQGGFSQLDDLLSIAASSGTTARPKLIPLTHRMMYLRAARNTILFRMTAADRMLILKPMHINSTYNSATGLLSVGGTLIAPPGFDGARFYDYLDTFQPTYCTAPAKMYETVLVHAPSHQPELARHTLRYLRAGSMPLPPALKAQIEALFKVPIFQTYGGIETGNIAANPPPPEANKAGSAGRLAAGKDILVVDANFDPVPLGVLGEVITRGPEVITAYEDEPELNASAFWGGWFRTGDLGYLDSDNYLFLTGRLKEQINRGGEKVSPMEVEAVLLQHPAIAEAATFAIPDKAFGDLVGCAVVLKPNQSVSERDVREFVSARLADFKVPSRVVVVDSLPRTDTGKLQRIGLADKLGLTAPSLNNTDSSPAAGFVAPRTLVEKQLAQLWDKVLGRRSEPISIYDEFIEIGGDSLSATRLISQIRKSLNVEISLLDIFDAPTIEQQAVILEKLIT